MTIRHTFAPLLLALGTCGSLGLAGAAQAATLQLSLLGSTTVPSGTVFQGVEFGGISGLDRAADGAFWALSDDRGNEGNPPRTPRFYNISLNLDSSGLHGVTINSMTYMQRPDGSTFPTTARTVDPEGIRVAPNGNLYFSSEGNWNANASLRYQPFVREMTTAGVFVREFATPSIYNYVDNATTGGRNNKLFEALTVTPDGSLYVANEDALVQDGSITTLSSGSSIRLTRLDPVTGQATAQYAYALPPIPVDSLPGSGIAPDSGLPEMLALDNDSFLMLERSFAAGVGNTIRIAESHITPQTTDVSGLSGLTPANHVAMTREVLLDMVLTYQGVTLDNIEAMTWGPTLANGNRTLVLAADNNFSRTQTTLFMAFEVTAANAVPEPQSAALALAALAGLAALRRGGRRTAATGSRS